MSKSGGNGGTGIATTANAPSNTLQATFKPVHVVAPPPAGTRPHTDLARAEKLTDLSSRGLIRHSQLFNKVAAQKHDPFLVKPMLAKIGGTAESARSFHSVPGFTAAESKGNIYPTNGGTSSERDRASLSSDGTAMSLIADLDADEDAGAGHRKSGWVLAWLANLIAAAGTCGLGWWLWQNAPKGARMTLPATVE